MALRKHSTVAAVLLLWLTLLLLLCGWGHRRTWRTSPSSSSSSSSFTHRKILLAKFGHLPESAHPALHRRHHHHHHHLHHHQHKPAAATHALPVAVVSPGPPGDDEIDPRYGVEKRIVPTGPNPLHH